MAIKLTIPAVEKVLVSHGGEGRTHWSDIHFIDAEGDSVLGVTCFGEGDRATAVFGVDSDTEVVRCGIVALKVHHVDQASFDHGSEHDFLRLYDGGGSLLAEVTVRRAGA